MAYSHRVSRRVLHTSDVHLVTLGDKACSSLVALVDLAIKAKVDLVMVAGDLFDHNRVNDNLVSFVAEQFRRLAIPVIILPGNHDCLVRGSVFERANLWQNCANVHIFRAPLGEMLDFPELGVSVWGKSHSSYDDDQQPMVGIPQLQKNGRWYLAMAHGYYIGDGIPFPPSYRITYQEIATSGCDYIALGHVPMFDCVCDEPVKAYYCGSPSMYGAVAIVDLKEETGVQVTCHSLEQEARGDK